MPALAFHLTWTTYGTWLPGDDRGWVKDNVSGIQEPDPVRKDQARYAMAESAVLLTEEQRTLVENTIRDHCRIRGWILHAVNVRTNHVHVVVSAERDPVEVMNQFKAWSSRKLSDLAGLTAKVARKAGRRRWWTEHGSTKLIFDERYLQDAIAYVLEGQDYNSP